MSQIHLGVAEDLIKLCQMMDYVCRKRLLVALRIHDRSLPYRKYWSLTQRKVQS